MLNQRHFCIVFRILFLVLLFSFSVPFSIKSQILKSRAYMFFVYASKDSIDYRKSQTCNVLIEYDVPKKKLKLMSMKSSKIKSFDITKTLKKETQEGDPVNFLSTELMKEKSGNIRGNAKVSLGLYKEALADFNVAISINSNDGESYFWRGITKLSLNDKEGGCLDLSKAGELGYIAAYAEIQKHCN